MTKNSMVSSSQSSTLLSSSSVSTPGKEGEAPAGGGAALVPLAPAWGTPTHRLGQPCPSTVGRRRGACTFPQWRTVTQHLLFAEKPGEPTHGRTGSKALSGTRRVSPASHGTSAQLQALALLLQVPLLGRLPVLPEVLHHGPSSLHQFLARGGGDRVTLTSHPHRVAEPTRKPVSAATPHQTA